MWKPVFMLVYGLLAIFVGTLGAKKKIGFGDALMLSLLVSPLIGFFVVRFSADRNAPDKTQTKADYEKFLSRQKTVLTDAEQDEFSTLLKQFSKGKISKQEFETQAAKFN